MFNLSINRRWLLCLAPLLLAAALPVKAAGNCGDPFFHWSGTTPPVNVRHVFCGEIATNGDPKGLHSIQLQATWTVVTGLSNVPVHTPAAIYNARVNFSNGRNKMSTFFPDQCTEAEIVNSVVYAFGHQTGPHPQWGVLGPSAPAQNAKGYCLTTAGAPFSIRMGLIGSGASTKVNTAFPN